MHHSVPLRGPRSGRNTAQGASGREDVPHHMLLILGASGTEARAAVVL